MKELNLHHSEQTDLHTPSNNRSRQILSERVNILFFFNGYRQGDKIIDALIFLEKNRKKTYWKRFRKLKETPHQEYQYEPTITEIE